MYKEYSSLDKILEKIPTSSSNTENFLVKGLKLDHATSDNSLVSLVLNYYIKKEPFVVFTSPSEGKADAIAELTREININNIGKEGISYNHNLCTVVTTDKYQSYLQYKGCENVVDIKMADISCPFLIFYNHMPSADVIQSLGKDTHVSIFMDYFGLFDPKGFKDYVKNAVSHLPSSFTYTTICKYPKSKKVDFLFGTKDSIKHASITGEINIFRDKKTLLYHSKQLESHIIKFFNENAIITSSNIEEYLYSGVIQSTNSENNQPFDILNVEKFNCLVFYDIDIDLVIKALDFIDNLVVIYTKDDYTVISMLGQILSNKGIDVPDFITKLNK